MHVIISMSAPKTLQEQANEDRETERLMLEHGPDGLEEAAEREQEKKDEKAKEQRKLDDENLDRLTTLGRPSADDEKSGAELQDEHDQLDPQKL